jgi:hypothetical protein
MEKADGLAGFVGAGHGHESESAGFAGELVLHESDFLNGAGFREEILEIDFGGVEGEVPYVEFGRHSMCFHKDRVSVAVSGNRISNCH